VLGDVVRTQQQENSVKGSYGIDPNRNERGGERDDDLPPVTPVEVYEGLHERLADAKSAEHSVGWRDFYAMDVAWLLARVGQLERLYDAACVADSYVDFGGDWTEPYDPPGCPERMQSAMEDLSGALWEAGGGGA